MTYYFKIILFILNNYNKYTKMNICKLIPTIFKHPENIFAK